MRWLFLLVLCIPFVFAHGTVVDHEFLASTDATHHFEVELVSLDGVPLPYAEITAVFTSARDSQEIVLHPMISNKFHYASDVKFLGEPYRVSLHIDPPAVMRGLVRKDSWTQPVDLQYQFDPRIGYSIEIANETVGDMNVHVFTAAPGPMWMISSDSMEMDHDMMGMDEEMSDMGLVTEDNRRDWMFTWYGFFAGVGLCLLGWWARHYRKTK